MYSANPILRNHPLLIGLAMGLLVSWGAGAEEIPDGYWTVDQASPLLDKTLRLNLDPALDQLTTGERQAVSYLLEAGEIMNRLYENSKHPEAESARNALLRLHADGTDIGRTQMLLDVYRFSKGPVVTTLDNVRTPFLPVAAETPGKNVYPVNIGREEIDGFFQIYPGQRDKLLHLRFVVRRRSAENVVRDLATLGEYPVLDTLHPGLRSELEGLSFAADTVTLYAVPYSVAYADDLMQAHTLLNKAADAVESDDAAFARYLRNRSRDFLSDDYESGDASWVTGRFKNLNLQIGSYETYDDALYGSKSFFSMSLLLRDQDRTSELASAIAGLQELEESLPYESDKKIREDIPVGVYDIIADFGQARGTNTATILPNENYLARQYGRTILLRGNILTNPELYKISQATFNAAVHPDFHDDLRLEGNLYRTLWHEIGHYLGADQTSDGRLLADALQDATDLYEELKSDLVSLYSIPLLTERGYHDAGQARAVYAAGILRVLQKVEPRRNQPYQTMQLMQWNWFLEHDVLEFDEASRTLVINYDNYHEGVTSFLARILEILQEGSYESADAFVRQYTTWNENLHGVIAANIRASEVYRYRLVTYGVENED